ncbi:MAG: alginate lyase family protein [Bacteroidota bacterium]
MPPRLVTALKFARQMGIQPLALYALYQLGVRSGHYRRAETRELGKSAGVDVVEANPAAPFKLPLRDELRHVLGEEGERRVRAAADEVASGQVRLFGGEPVALQLRFDQPLHHWTEYETNPALLAGFGIPNNDIKFLWEPARFAWAFTLGRGYHLLQEERYAEAFWSHFEEFTAANPAYLGPHWMNSQEAALRLMAFAWAGQVFQEASRSTPSRRLALREAIRRHAERIALTLVYARSQNNNHLVTEAAGLYTAGLALDNPRWRDLGWHWLNWSFQHQISGYGEYIQHSTNYHRLTLQAALWADAIKDRSWPRRSLEALKRASHFLFSVLDPVSGGVPNLGANDGALMLPLSEGGFSDFRPTVQAAARAFLKTQMPPGSWDELSLWLGLGPAAETYEPEHYLSDNLRGSDSWAYLRASRFKSRLGHMDQLHLDLWWRGMNITQDAGTYLYNGPPPWDNPLVGTRVHNTVTVDGRDQMKRAGRFLVLDWFPAYSHASVETDAAVLQRVSGYHRGYRGVLHERVVTIRSDGRWLIEDTLTAAASHVYRLHWLLPDWELEISGRESGEAGTRAAEVRIRSPLGWITLTMGTSSPGSEPRFSLARVGQLIHGKGEALPFEGWVSPAYGVKMPALSAALEVDARQGVRFTTQIRFPS